MDRNIALLAMCSMIHTRNNAQQQQQHTCSGPSALDQASVMLTASQNSALHQETPAPWGASRVSPSSDAVLSRMTLAKRFLTPLNSVLRFQPTASAARGVFALLQCRSMSAQPHVGFIRISFLMLVFLKEVMENVRFPTVSSKTTFIMMIMQH